MDQSDLIRLALLSIAVLFSAFFSGSEAAFLSLDRGRVAQLQQVGGKRAKRVARLANHPEKLFPTVLTGNNLANTAAAALGTTLAASFLSTNNAVIASTVVVTAILLLFAETIPKTLASKNSSRFAMITVAPLQVAERLLFPVVWLLERLTGAVGRLFGVSGAGVVMEEEIRALIELGRQAGEVDPKEAHMLEQVFRFGDRQLRETMTPRTEIIWIERGASQQEFLKTYSEHSHTRFPIYEDSIENVLGTLSVKDVVRAMASGELKPEDDATRLLRPAHFVPETKQVGALFQELQGSGYQIVMAVDEFGGIAGLATFKQMLEEIMGRVGEEGHQEEQEFQVIDANTYEVEGGMHVDEANEHLAIEIPDGDYETVAGFLLVRLGHIPTAGEFVRHGGFVLEVTRMRGVKIEQLKLTKIASPIAEGER